VRTLARVLGVEFNRVQFTPDLMPADITGTNVFNLARNEFTLIKGPVFTSFLLADEINRAPRQDAVRAVAGDAGAGGDD
jgi:MoxR-like ATPase